MKGLALTAEEWGRPMLEVAMERGRRRAQARMALRGTGRTEAVRTLLKEKFNGREFTRADVEKALAKQFPQVPVKGLSVTLHDMASAGLLERVRQVPGGLMTYRVGGAEVNAKAQRRKGATEGDLK